MKVKEIESINWTMFGTKDSSGLGCDVTVKAIPGMGGIDEGYEGYENFLTLVKLEDGSERTLLFLENYGDDMPKRIKKRIFGKNNLVAVIDINTKVFYLGTTFKEGENLSLSLVRMSIPLKENSGEEIHTNEFYSKLNWKRPYHFEIDYWSFERFLDGETGWSDLRDGLKAVVRLGDVRYIATYENE